MNNTRSLAVIFWCFIVLITCCFSLHLGLKSQATFTSSPSEMTALYRPVLARTTCLALLLSPLVGRNSEFLLCPGFSLLLCRIFRLHNFCSITCRFRSTLFLYTIKEMRVLHVLLLCHISRRPTLASRIGQHGQNCKDINTTTIHSYSCPSTFLHHPISHRLLRPSSFCRDFYFMKCFGSTIFKLTRLSS